MVSQSMHRPKDHLEKSFPFTPEIMRAGIDILEGFDPEQDSAHDALVCILEVARREWDLLQALKNRR